MPRHLKFPWARIAASGELYVVDVPLVDGSTNATRPVDRVQGAAFSYASRRGLQARSTRVFVAGKDGFEDVERSFFRLAVQVRPSTAGDDWEWASVFRLGVIAPSLRVCADCLHEYAGGACARCLEPETRCPHCGGTVAVQADAADLQGAEPTADDFPPPGFTPPHETHETHETHDA